MWGTPPEKWEEIGQVWEGLLSLNICVDFEVVSDVIGLRAAPEDILEHIPSFEDRVRIAARYLFISEAKARGGKDETCALFEVDNYLDTEDGEKALKAKMESVRNLLSSEISLSDIKGDTPSSDKNVYAFKNAAPKGWNDIRVTA